MRRKTDSLVFTKRADKILDKVWDEIAKKYPPKGTKCDWDEIVKQCQQEGAKVDDLKMSKTMTGRLKTHPEPPPKQP